MRYICFAVLFGVLPLMHRNSCAIGLDSGISAGLRPYKDIHGNSYKKSENLFKDKDQNGVRNIYQKRDRQQTKENKRRR